MNVELVSKTEINKQYFEQVYYDSLNMMNNYGDDMPEITTEQLIIYIARVSSSRDNKEKLEDHEKLINYLINHKHWSPFEHAYMTVEITTSRAMGRQELRHWSKRFQEFSQRYAQATTFEPVELRWEADKNRQSSKGVIGTTELVDNLPYYNIEDEEVNNTELEDDIQYMSHLMREVHKTYNELIDKGVAKECARFYLPECTTTTMYSTGNIRSWMHWLSLRDHGDAQKEIVEIAQEIGSIFQQEYPLISQALDFNYE